MYSGLCAPPTLAHVCQSWGSYSHHVIPHFMAALIQTRTGSWLRSQYRFLLSLFHFCLFSLFSGGEKSIQTERKEQILKSEHVIASCLKERVQVFSSLPCDVAFKDKNNRMNKSSVKNCFVTPVSFSTWMLHCDCRSGQEISRAELPAIVCQRNEEQRSYFLS